MKKILGIIAIVVGMTFSCGLAMTPAWAKCSDHPDDKNCVDTNILGTNGEYQGDDQGGGIWMIINIVLTVMTFGVVTLATLGLVISGAQYITAADNAERMAKAKNRIINVLIGLAAYAVMWAALNWLLPGGIFH